MNFATGGGTATVGDDYTAASGTLTFAGSAGEVQTFTVATVQDDNVETDETVQVSLSELTPSDLPIDIITGVANVDAVMIMDGAPTVEITGDFTGEVTERGALNPGETEIATGRLVLVGGTFTEQAGTDGMYGSFALEVDEANSTWTYTLNNDNDDTNALAAGASVMETFPVQSSDNTPAQVVITITGANDAPTAVIDEAPMLVVVAGSSVTLNSSGSADPDTGGSIDSYLWSVASDGVPPLELKHPH